MGGNGATARGDNSSASDPGEGAPQQAGPGSVEGNDGDVSVSKAGRVGTVSPTTSPPAGVAAPQPGNSRPSLSSHRERPGQAKRSDSSGGYGGSGVHGLAAGHVASLACGPPMWGQLRRGLLEAALQAAQQTNSMSDVWEVCAALLRCVCMCVRVRACLFAAFCGETLKGLQDAV
eukprot:scaffold50976_cov20-Tisochrysis_lutea.AAC.4